MPQIIENPKTYSGRELETIFFRPMLTGPDAMDLGVRIMYNMPVPTTIQLWDRAGDALMKYAKGWTGGDLAKKLQKTINLQKVKAEMGYSAQDYFSMIYELITNRADVNLDDLSGTELEQAETTLFRRAIAESIRVTMWLGDTSREGSHKYNSFDGFLKAIKRDLATDADTDVDAAKKIKAVKIPDMTTADAAISLFERLWDNAPLYLQDMKDEGNLVFNVTADVYHNYEKSLEGTYLESAFAAMQNGRRKLTWRGIPIVNVGLTGYLSSYEDMPQSFGILTDRRNLTLAVNTSDFPGNEVRMWYNPDEMENRQRAIFMAGCEYLEPRLMVAALDKEKPSASGGTAETKDDTETTE